MDLNCVEGWDFTAKWTGPSLTDIFNDAGVQPEAVTVIFYTADTDEGYTSLDLEYILDNDIIIALKDNDITLSPERGFSLPGGRHEQVRVQVGQVGDEDRAVLGRKFQGLLGERGLQQQGRYRWAGF